MTSIPGPASHSFVSQRLRMHYVDWGNPDAPPLILQHGGRDHCRSWDWVAQALRKDWHVICPDLRGHGDSAWSPDAHYTSFSFVSDMAQLVQTLGYDQVTICAHSLGGNIATLFTGLYPDKVRRLANIEGLGVSPLHSRERDAKPYPDRIRQWIAERHAAAGRLPRRYARIEDAIDRMRAANPQLTEEQVRHLTIHGVNRNEDGSYVWKFDPYLNVWPVANFPQEEIHGLWGAITCPVQFFYGGQSFAVDPRIDGRITHFRDADVHFYPDAGHWLHHDQFDRFVTDLRAFLA
ncbi:alpha/beta fold hydrolase [Novosphingobium sp. FSY-8]|uniref:Alpha/beta fold hydrolase n=1 Tax=Novosphingobium ovatum TaxID=1908523 RepID=A0ABW9XBZ8_9SPHN|nr:alpha/beta hydrolase [Novosphingobium ovatum]NBC36059.1 alpha/beta fold hydrolase [Novosphingobium ovatum]